LVLGSLAIERGDFAAAATTLSEARAVAERSPARAHLAPRIAAEVARLALYQGSLEDARQHAAAAHAAAVEHECRRCGAGIAATAQPRCGVRSLSARSQAPPSLEPREGGSAWLRSVHILPPARRSRSAGKPSTRRRSRGATSTSSM